MLGLNEIREHVITQGTKWRSPYSDYGTIWIIEGCVFESFHSQDTFFSLKRRDHFRGPPSLLFIAYRGLLQRVNGGRSVMLTNPSLVPRLRIHGALPPQLQTPSCHAHRDNLYQ